MNTGKTQNYDLPQYEDNDKEQYRSDFNVAMRQIDKKLKEVADAGGGGGGGATWGGITGNIENQIDLKTKLDNINVNIENKVDKVYGKGLSENDFTNVDKTMLSNHETKINQIDESLDDEIDNRTNEVSALAGRIASLETTMPTKVNKSDTYTKEEVDNKLKASDGIKYENGEFKHTNNIDKKDVKSVYSCKIDEHGHIIEATPVSISLGGDFIEIKNASYEYITDGGIIVTNSQRNNLIFMFGHNAGISITSNPQNIDISYVGSGNWEISFNSANGTCHLSYDNTNYKVKYWEEGCSYFGRHCIFYKPRN